MSRHHLLRVDASSRREASVTRALADRLVERLAAETVVTERDLADPPLPFVDGDWIAANITPDEARTQAHHQVLTLSETLIGEWEQSDAVVIACPIYNFGVPAAMKAYIDLICRAQRTFRYSTDGPVGLLANRPTYLVMASGGTRLGSPIDFASGYLRHVLSFIGITDLHVIAADGQSSDTEARSRAEAAIDDLTLPVRKVKPSE
ncbi:MAG: NAD(P)H-dependent oxidoreductase [Pseudomonadota bacterium]